ncbi:hypothetical protein HON22_01960, partial [Candidatus Peregrinibacteria bacterium]|nr:hypothetical protein [Candidatus Peregrinibacteria bacterium]
FNFIFILCFLPLNLKAEYIKIYSDYEPIEENLVFTDNELVVKVWIDKEKRKLKVSSRKRGEPSVIEFLSLNSYEEFEQAQDQLASLYSVFFSLDPFKFILESGCDGVFLPIPLDDKSIARLVGDVENVVEQMTYEKTDFKKYPLTEIVIPGIEETIPIFAIVDRDENIKKFYIGGDKEKIKGLRIERVAGQILIKGKNGEVLKRIKSEDFNKSTGGSLKVYNKSERTPSLKITLTNSTTVRGHQWEVNKTSRIPMKEMLKRDRNPGTHLGVDVMASPFTLITSIVDNVVGSLLMNTIFVGTDFKEKVRETTSDELREIDALMKLFCKDELEEISNEVASKCKFSTIAPISSTTKTAQCGINIVIPKITDKLLENYTEGKLSKEKKKEYQKTVHGDFLFCNKKAEDQYEIDNCLKSFERSVYYRIGKVISNNLLENQLKKAKVPQKVLDKALLESEFMLAECANENFFPGYDKNKIYEYEHRFDKKPFKEDKEPRECSEKPPKEEGPKPKKSGFSPEASIQACTYTGAIKAVDTVISTMAEIGLEEAFLSKIPDGEKKVLTDAQQAEISKKSRDSQKVYRDCVADKGLFLFTKDFKYYDYKKLTSKTKASFKAAITSCGNQVLLDASSFAVKHLIETDSRILDLYGSDPKKLDDVVKIGKKALKNWKE